MIFRSIHIFYLMITIWKRLPWNIISFYINNNSGSAMPNQSTKLYCVLFSIRGGQLQLTFLLELVTINDLNVRGKQEEVKHLSYLMRIIWYFNTFIWWFLIADRCHICFDTRVHAGYIILPCYGDSISCEWNCMISNTWWEIH